MIKIRVLLTLNVYSKINMVIPNYDIPIEQKV